MWRSVPIASLILALGYQAVMADGGAASAASATSATSAASEVFHGTLIGPLLGISCIPDAWLRVCQYPDSVMSVTSESIDLSLLYDQAVGAMGSFYLCRGLFGERVTLFEIKEVWPEACPVIAVAPASWGFIKTIHR